MRSLSIIFRFEVLLVLPIWQQDALWHSILLYQVVQARYYAGSLWRSRLPWIVKRPLLGAMKAKIFLRIDSHLTRALPEACLAQAQGVRGSWPAHVEHVLVLGWASSTRPSPLSLLNVAAARLDERRLDWPTSYSVPKIAISSFNPSLLLSWHIRHCILIIIELYIDACCGTAR